MNTFRIKKMFGLSTMKLKLSTDEYITSISGHYDQNAINRLEIKTSKDQEVTKNGTIYCDRSLLVLR
jgi:hypothetical protein